MTTTRRVTAYIPVPAAILADMGFEWAEPDPSPFPRIVAVDILDRAERTVTRVRRAGRMAAARCGSALLVLRHGQCRECL